MPNPVEPRVFDVVAIEAIRCPGRDRHDWALTNGRPRPIHPHGPMPIHAGRRNGSPVALRHCVLANRSPHSTNRTRASVGCQGLLRSSLAWTQGTRSSTGPNLLVPCATCLRHGPHGQAGIHALSLSIINKLGGKENIHSGFT